MTTISNIEKAVTHLSEAIKFKTISYPGYDRMDFNLFGEFLNFLELSYPNIHNKCKKAIVNNYSPVYHWEGENKDLKPILLIGHYDVVPVEESTLKDWAVDPFEGVVKDNYIWGRGTLDNKNQVISVLEAVEHLITIDYIPNRDIYFAFGYDEEIGGARGAKMVSEYFEEIGIEFECVLDEGGAIIQGMMEGLEKPAALIGVAEKGSTNVKISVKGQGGHSSMPPSSTAIDTLADIVANVNKNPMSSRLTEPVKEMFTTMAPHMRGKTFLLNNIKPLFPIIKNILAKNPVTNSLIRTTIAFTMIEGGDAPNVLPQNAWAIANLRILQGDSIDSTIEHVRRVNPNHDLEIEKLLTEEPSIISDIHSPAYEILTSTIKDIYPEVLVMPYLMAGATDSRHYYSICKNIYRFMAVNVSQEDFNSIHSNNERISFENLASLINFYIKFIKKF